MAVVRLLQEQVWPVKQLHGVVRHHLARCFCLSLATAPTPTPMALVTLPASLVTSAPHLLHTPATTHLCLQLPW